MGYKIAGRTIKEYITMIKKPLMAIIVLEVLNFLINLPSNILGNFILSALIGLVSVILWIVMLVIGGYIGYIVVKNYKGDLATAGAAGAVAGVILGLVGAIFLLINAVVMTVFSPLLIGFILVGAIVGIIVYPIIGLVGGAILAIIGGAVAGSSSFESASKK